MKTKTIVKVMLIGFVALSLSWLVIKQNQKATTPFEPNVSAAEGTSNSLPASGAPAASNPGVPTLPDRVIAYYFHTTFRCSTCYTIEAYTREAIEGGFARELRDGRLVFQVINIEEHAHSHFIKDYQLVTKSVVLADIKNGGQTRWKNLPKIWELVQNKEAFLKYVRDEVNLYLQGK